MKPFLSFFVILILFQTLILGSLVKIEFPDSYQAQWDETLLHKQVVLDPFLVPGRDGINQNLTCKNEWVPFNYSKIGELNNNSVQPPDSDIRFQSKRINNHKNIPVYILNGTIRI